MTVFDFQLGKFSNTARLFKLVSRMSEDKQFILLKTLLRHNVSTYLFQLIIDMNEDQQTQLLDQLTEISYETTPTRTISLDDYEASMRENPRKPCLINTNFRIQEHDFKSYILDVSIGGVFIETNEKFPDGKELLLKFSLPNRSQPFTFSGKIAWSGPKGFGVQFGDVTQAQGDVLRSFIEQNEQEEQ